MGSALKLSRGHGGPRISLRLWRIDAAPWHANGSRCGGRRHYRPRRGGPDSRCRRLEDFILRGLHWSKLGVANLTLVRHATASQDALRVGAAWLEAASPEITLWPWVMRSVRDLKHDYGGTSDLVESFLKSQPNHRIWARSGWTSAASNSARQGGARAPGSSMDRGPSTVIRISRRYSPHQSGPSRALSFVPGDGSTGELRDGLRDLGVHWLIEADAAADGWSYAFSALWKTSDLPPDQRRSLEATVETWLEDVPDHHGWSFVFHMTCWTTKPSAAFDVSLKWACQAVEREGRLEHAGRAYVLETLLKRLSADNPKLREAVLADAEAWLHETPPTKGGRLIWRILEEQGGPTFERLRDWGADWLANAALDDPFWRSWRFQPRRAEPAKTGTDKANLGAKRGHDWLIREADHRAWPWMLQCALPSKPPVVELAGELFGGRAGRLARATKPMSDPAGQKPSCS